MIGELMIARAKRVFPGMVMSLLLSAPALASTPATEKATLVPHRPANAGQGNAAQTSGRKLSRPTVGQAPAAKTTVVRQELSAKLLPGNVPTVSTRGAEAMATMKTGVAGKPVARTTPVAGAPLIRRTGSQVMARQLIDDGTLWREKGAVTTWQQTGIASWYGGARWQGHRMSSGTRYDENQLTAAHATLPIGTRVRVVLHDSPKFVIVTITDRPGTRTRIIDLSRKAAQDLGILSRGVAMVTLQPV
jgi:rare lipoprotein A (peptidoglycan hydrolase)